MSDDDAWLDELVVMALDLEVADTRVGLADELFTPNPLLAEIERRRTERTPSRASWRR